ncbi:flagellar basal-body rod protein FlgG [Methylophilus sp. Leaf408]|jgi:flagellar basal-body rod protein FlgG|uniref:flagellar basal-body rod protein FlgG n=1 Tax=Methylophilus sp. Leaf408 TaxID=2876561 RepID=UPI001E4CEB23|nr:flagellar basal-body rod protein FlgG [Methylophilus sp. Leaf408]
MIDALYIGATGMQAQQQHVDVIANNLANVNTSGFKKNRVLFQDAYYRAQQLSASGEANQAILLGMGTLIASNNKSFLQGDVKATESPLDLAIRGNGFFEVLLPDGSSAYTRHGALKVNENGVLATVSGYELKQQIEIPVDSVEVVIDASGKVSSRNSKDNALAEIGQIELSSFSNSEGLKPVGDNLFTVTDAAGQVTVNKPGEDGLGTLAQGYLEGSNVKLSEEMVNLVLAQRAYELSAKVIQASDEMLSISNNLRR